MAKVIDFYVPKNFRRRAMRTAQLQHGKVIEFCSATKSAAARGIGWGFGWFLGATVPIHAVVSE
jgi:hypothetical protein